MGFYWDNGKENGNYYRNIGFLGIREKEMETTLVILGLLGYWKRKWKLITV